MEDVACLTIRRGEMCRREDTSTKRSKFEGLFDDDSVEACQFLHMGYQTMTVRTVCYWEWSGSYAVATVVSHQ